MLIRDTGRIFTPHSRNAKDSHPLRRTAEGLGAYLDRLSQAVQDGDSVDSDIGSRGRNSSRRFKFASLPDELKPPVEFDLTEEEAAALNMLKEARNIAVDASSVIVSLQDRMVSQERLQAIFADLAGDKGIEILWYMLDEAREAAGGDFPFSLLTPEAARGAHAGIEGMIVRFLDVGAAGKSGAGSPNSSLYVGHDAAIGAAEQLRDFLLNEGPVRAFARFREINRSNVLGLLQ
ncbi:MAG: hypothetical protein LBU70_08040 [Chitinispirillales bacterium]|jgi:hypothetical protein|nr:hypothetical protein [Chitinispirillales bacterium]